MKRKESFLIYLRTSVFDHYCSYDHAHLHWAMDRQETNTPRIDPTWLLFYIP
jgi:hypothetical protein